MEYTEAEKRLARLIEWAIGNRGSKNGNPYAIPEVEGAMAYLAKRQGHNSYLNAETKSVAELPLG